MSFGSYLIWEAQPEYRVFVDSRIELYPVEIWKDYLEVSSAMGDWEATLDKYGVNTLMLSLDTQWPLVEEARKSHDWQLVFQDNKSAVFMRGSRS